MTAAWRRIKWAKDSSEVPGPRKKEEQQIKDTTGKISDPVSHPVYYTFGEIEVLDAIEDWRLPYHLANAVKYIARHGRKPGCPAKQDLEKARFYITRYIENVLDKRIVGRR